jgi:hypothetical protein
LYIMWYLRIGLRRDISEGGSTGTGLAERFFLTYVR